MHIITVKKNCQSDDYFEQDGIHFHFLKIPQVPRVGLLFQVDLYRIRRCLRSIQPDVVHGFGTESGYGFSAVNSGYPSVLMMQGIVAEIVGAMGKRMAYFNPMLILTLLLERQTIRRCRHFVCETNFSADYVRRVNPSANIHLIGNLVRNEFYGLRRVPNSDIDLLFVGSIIPAKGVEVLLKAFARILASFPKAHLHLAGVSDDKYFYNVLNPLMANLDLQDRVVFHGYCTVDTLLPLFAHAKLVVLPTLMDTAPNVLAEALVAGVPVVASAVGGIPEMLSGGALGVLVQPGSVDSLVEGISQVLLDPVEATNRASSAQAKAQREFNIENQAHKLVDVYQLVVAQ